MIRNWHDQFFKIILIFLFLLVSVIPAPALAFEYTPILVTGTVNLDPEIQPTLLDAIKKAQKREVFTSDVLYFAPTNLSSIGSFDFISLAGMVSYRENWRLEDDVVWMGVMVIKRGSHQSAVEGTPEFSFLLGQIPESLMPKNIKDEVDPLAVSPITTGTTSPETPRFPWDTAYYMQYGSFGVHNNGFSSVVSGWKAVDFFSDANTGVGHAPNRLLASLSGSISYVCKDSHSVAIKIGNFFYSHLIDNANLKYGTSFSQGDLLGQLQSGDFNDTCGYATQASDAFHVHWGFPNLGTLEVSGWTLDISSGTWTDGNQTKDVFDWFYADQTYCTGPSL
ncbi:MAG TPA: hypothetical protein PK989_05085, partial [Anaerolineales bacterium]|nr:hypothetical protein [Anaerolineales bacterium]